MKIFKIVLLVLFVIVDLFCLYSSVCYFAMGASYPRIYGKVEAHFMGMNLMGVVFFVCYVLLLIPIILLTKDMLKTKYSRQ